MQQRLATWVNSFAESMVGSRREAIVFSALTSVVPFMTWVSVVIICLITLRKGVKEGGLVLLVTLIPVILVGAFFLSPLLVLENVVFSFVIIWAFACLLRSTESWSYVLEAAALTGLIIIFLIHLLVPDIQHLYVDYLLKAFKKVNSESNAVVSAQMKQYLVHLAKYLTGVQASLYIVGGLLNLLIARWLQARLYNPGGLIKELLKVRLHWVSGVVMALCVTSIALDSNVALDSILVLFTIFMLAGMSLVHYLANARPAGKKWYLLAFYAALIVFIPFSFIPVILLSFIDIWIDVRSRV